MTDKAVVVTRDGGRVTLGLNRPSRRNALNAESWSSILDELRRAEADTNSRVVVIRSDGPVFCAGNDIKEAEVFPTPSDAKRYFQDTTVPTLEAMARSPLPIIAEVHGAALGSGVELLQFCDIVIAVDSATFQLPEARLGLWATVFVGSTQSLGVRRAALELSLTTEPYTAQRAFQSGLNTRVVPDHGLRQEVGLVVAGLMTKGRDAVAKSKRYANRSLIREGLVAVRDALEEHCEVSIFSADGIEGVSAFIEKRAPVFS
ncbi:hypothetical protein BOH66_06225 [Microbacterium aurum]|uniref:Enoyl-CoA hydratase n=1 Tax=Microbacterium aurum TaxID=36805 RepID=A0A1P8U701_9MICO|nr:enoyl-CoA hydratase-related protein [Microbacterium aurum]APZ33895.1 hypothetical protein BOH66_06225 [Microbacterium aurum]MBM7827656.1 enoyl-CoA hydratase/carnithine racemase [Microbacterium aurum]